MTQNFAASRGDDISLGIRFWLKFNNAELIVHAHPPTIGRVRFANVDREKLRHVLMLQKNLFQDPRLGSEGASREAAENQHHRFTAQLTERHGAGSILTPQGEVRRHVVNRRA